MAAGLHEAAVVAVVKDLKLLEPAEIRAAVEVDSLEQDGDQGLADPCPLLPGGIAGLLDEDGQLLAPNESANWFVKEIE